MPHPGGRIGFFGFGGSARLALPLASHLGFETVVCSGTPTHAALARELGATEVVLGFDSQESAPPEGFGRGRAIYPLS